MTSYPIIQILLYLSFLFSPPEATRITLTGPDTALEINRTPIGWRMERDGKTYGVTKRSVIGEDISSLEKLDEYVVLAKGHDWDREPKLTLEEATTLEKNADGFILRLNDDTPAVRTYTVVFHRRPQPAPDEPALQINVIGAVTAPGAYRLPIGATMPDALVAAGGVYRFADRSRIRIARGPAGEKPIPSIHNLEIIMKEPTKAPILQDGDTIYVPEIIF